MALGLFLENSIGLLTILCFSSVNSCIKKIVSYLVSLFGLSLLFSQHVDVVLFLGNGFVMGTWREMIVEELASQLEPSTNE